MNGMESITSEGNPDGFGKTLGEGEGGSIDLVRNRCRTSVRSAPYLVRRRRFRNRENKQKQYKRQDPSLSKEEKQNGRRRHSLSRILFERITSKSIALSFKRGSI